MKLTRSIPALWILATAAHAAPVFTSQTAENEVRILANGKLHCAYVFRGSAKPYVYPLTAPDGVTLNREFPMRNIAGESHDHPHHSSMWFAHEKANGQDTWNIKHGTIETLGTPEVTIENNAVLVKSKARWIGKNGVLLGLESTLLRFGALTGDERFIDFAITLSGDNGPLTLGDAKDGAMGLRLRDEFNFKNPETTASNSEGDDKSSLWSKRAKWVSYETKLEGGYHGVALLNEPTNPLSPPRWHARDYGLLAVNPFGEKAFDPSSTKEGGITVESGKSITFKYRAVLYTGKKGATEVETLFKEFATASDSHK
ncbi:MAG: PmoA family protein [Verrucomicrobiota bacterium]